MSLINDMLRDLEARSSDELKRQNLQNAVRPLPASVSTIPWKIGGFVALAILLLAAVWFFWRDGRLAPENSTDLSKQAGYATKQLLSAPPAPSSEPVALVLSSTIEAPEQGALLSPPGRAALPPPAPTSSPNHPKKELPAIQASVVEKTELRVTATAPAVPPPTNKTGGDAPNTPTFSSLPAEAKAPSGKIEVRKATATPRERADADYRLAQSAFSSGNTQEGLEALRRALQQDADYVPARQQLVQQLLEQRHLEAAASVLSDGLEHQPRQTGWAMALARLQVEKSDLVGAERTLTRYAEFAVANPEYQGFHAHLRYRLGQHAGATALYQNACRLAAGEGRWWFGLGLSLEAEGLGSEAREAFRQSLATGTLNNELSAQAQQRLR